MSNKGSQISQIIMYLQILLCRLCNIPRYPKTVWPTFASSVAFSLPPMDQLAPICASSPIAVSQCVILRGFMRFCVILPFPKSVLHLAFLSAVAIIGNFCTWTWQDSLASGYTTCTASPSSPMRIGSLNICMPQDTKRQKKHCQIMKFTKWTIRNSWGIY